jgi:division protein CdvB (Snf7/Vps24/ESCRT-III family)
LIEGVDKKEVPVSILQEIIVTLIDNTEITVDVRHLLSQGESAEDIEKMLDDKFVELDEYIRNVDFLVDIEKVVSTVKPETDKVLKDL